MLKQQLITSSIDVILVVDFNGKQQVYDCSSVSIVYSLNALPRAQVTVAAGVCLYAAKNEPGRPAAGQFADIHQTFNQFKELPLAKLRIRLTGKMSKDQDWPTNEWQDLFEGYVVAKAPQRTVEDLTVTIHIVHWLFDLAFASMLSGKTHPESIYHQPFRAAAINAQKDCCVEGSTPFETQTNPAAAALLTQLANTSHITSSNLQKDLWGACLYPWLCTITSLDIFTYLRQGHIKPVTNERAQTALKRIEGVCAPSRWYKPLKLETSISSVLTHHIRTRIGDEQVQAYATTTMWDVLIKRLAPDYSFSVVPRTSSALVCPFFPGNRTPFLTIWRDDYGEFTPMLIEPRPIHTVIVIGGRVYPTLQGPTTTPESISNTINGGSFSPTPTPKHGMFLVRAAPAWAVNLVSTGATRTKDTQMPPTTTTPDTDTPKQEEDPASSFLDRLAHDYYVQETLRGRTGALTGRLRFDIAPGSTVKIESAPLSHIKDDQLTTYWFGEVIRVTITISCERRLAETTLQLANLRTQEENESDAFSASRHPLYSEVWSGAPLIDNYYVE